MKKLTLPAPAKLNLLLHITGQRKDGYHELQTVFQLLDFGDELEFTLADATVSVETNTDCGIPPEENLVYKAACLLKKQCSIPHAGIHIKLLKRLPQGGGIGGGSSDAATTLVGLNRLWNTNLNIESLATIGAQLGADVPVFVRGRSAWGEGVGENLRPLILPEAWYVVLRPPCHVSTKVVFSHKELTRNTPPITVAAFLKEGGKNDCQPLVERLFPEVGEALDWLNQYSAATQMTGTGSCVFGTFPNEEDAQAVFAKRPKRFEGFVAKGINNSPLLQYLLS